MLALPPASAISPQLRASSFPYWEARRPGASFEDNGAGRRQLGSWQTGLAAAKIRVDDLRAAPGGSGPQSAAVGFLPGSQGRPCGQMAERRAFGGCGMWVLKV